MKAGVGSLGAGALAGIASYGGAMMFATASTGTAIASLSGVAATNATMAWFGGGSLAAGGLGMAGGSLVLGGIVAGPVLAVAGFIMAAKSEENLAEAEKMYSEARLAAEQMDTMTSFIEKVSEIAYNYEDFIVGFKEIFRPNLTQLRRVYDDNRVNQERFLFNRIRKIFGLKIKVDYRKLNITEQYTLHITWLMAQIIYSVLSAPILGNDGEMAPNAQVVLEEAQTSAIKMLEVGV